MAKKRKKRTPRMYVQRLRADQQAQTRERIVAATAELHQALGPARTTISAIAERAGVQRLTVYRHFPDEESLFAACSSHWGQAHPPPPAAEGEPEVRTRATLEALYAYYRRTREMWKAVYRDREEVPAVEAPLRHFESHVAGLRESLLQDWPASARAAVRAALGHALRFSTWQSLAEEGLSDARMAQAMERWIHSMSDPPGAGRAVRRSG